MKVTPIVKDSFLTDFTFADITKDYYVNYMEAGVGLRYQFRNSDDCFDLAWDINSERGQYWKLSGAVANGGEELFDTSKSRGGGVKVCDRYVDLWLEKY